MKVYKNMTQMERGKYVRLCVKVNLTKSLFAMRENNTVMEENRDRLNQGTHENNAIGNKVISKSKEIVGKGKVVGNNEENIRKAERENRKINKGKK